ncbi:histidine N-alpha-methyltransferase [Kitasatospora herbaricolor]|uniref:L-histidine N(alpha)-methyltransferase n=1 Tax=Kitasatospora herbaricolor TaxID=68217 RepID=UPI00174DAF7A|nr:L-histidine N(alpha)-methyltransferase [Kitasatospora herbaricolor]MDQ0311804.1 L-histidine N-alpha-methyltransferase [Kitasatospora herbaricolor]GGU96524.1 histidine N-alpha-methyltransferase [Kitasatospora herbaricolor]
MQPFDLTRLLPADHFSQALRHDVQHGLTSEPKWLPPKWFYDARGSDLFEEITRLPEYYPTRAERAILTERAGEIAAASKARTLVELGSGSSEKTRLLLDALHELGTLDTYVPVDVSESALTAAGQALAEEYPELRVRAVLSDFTAGPGLPPDGGPRLVAFLGGTLGNLLPPERAEFLSTLRGMVDHGDSLLLGTDLVKDPAVLVAAYDDSAGVTAEFNKNVLNVLNRELAADFDPAAFEHVALWDAEQEWIEMRLRSLRTQTVKIPALDLPVHFEAGEELRTEVSAKFRRDRVADELAAAGFRLSRWWTDEAGRFGLSLAEPV